MYALIFQRVKKLEIFEINIVSETIRKVPFRNDNLSFKLTVHCRVGCYHIKSHFFVLKSQHYKYTRYLKK